MTLLDRKKLKEESNNSSNPNKNVCGLAIASALGVSVATRYIHTWSDLQRAIRHMWSFRSVASAINLASNDTVGSIRNKVAKHFKTSGCIVYVVWVEGHVLMLGPKGETHVDTAPRERDRRKVIKVYGVYPSTKNTTKLQRLKKYMAKSKGG
jgi:hypothetical protein